MKTYSFRIIGTSIIEDTEFTTLQSVKNHIRSFYGKTKFEYWGKHSGETYA